MTGPRYLIDTHVLIWALDGDPRLSERHRKLLDDGSQIAVSVVSLWEIAIKKALGKLTIRSDLPEILDKSGITLLPIDIAHIAVVEALPHHHRDPFDRMLVAQAISEDLCLLSVDPAFRAYDVTIA